jgi:hypothetical protein
MRLRLPDRIKDKVGAFPESSYGAHLVTLILDDGTRIPHVRIAGWDEIVADPLPSLTSLDASRIVDVESEV